MESEPMYALIDVLNETVLLESFDFNEIQNYIDREGAKYVILDVVVVK